MIKSNKIVSFDIKNYKGIKYLIQQTEEQRQNYYWFSSEIHKEAYIDGFIKYEKKDQDKSIVILTEILNNFKFK
ncbi:hypothetical protein GCM10011413_12540 [Pedobacter psychrotolerans]|uniref:Uncharacterized protein n=1 Tax=Pedobacter psychrotolerans TaxID=1843235 RepID=A0ABQ1SPI9_9SPHI|nr:hypothetical protein GCM10011413_12540 [Pedobacter psychrotolerans]